MDARMRVPDSELEFDAELTYRWRGQPYTGIGYDDTSTSGVSEISYRDGRQHGPARDWYPSGILKAQTYFRENTVHGVACEYNPDGTVTSETVYEYGIKIRRLERDARGSMHQTYRLSPDDPLHTLLERYRSDRGWRSPD